MPHTDAPGLHTLAFKPENSGFWYRIGAPVGTKYWFSFVAVGTGGHQMAADVTGQVGWSEDWIYWPTHFQVIHAGATDVEFHNGSPDAEPQLNAERSVLVARGTSGQPGSHPREIYVPTVTRGIEAAEVFSPTPYYQ